MIITARFASTCGKCGLQIQQGEQIWYTKRGNRYQKAGRALHRACYDPSSTDATYPESVDMKPTWTSVDIGNDDSSNHDETTSDYTRDFTGTVHTEAYHNGTYHEALKSATGHNGLVNTSATETLTKALKELIGVTPIDDKAVRDIFKQETQSLSGDLIALIAEETAKIQTPAVTVTLNNTVTGETKDLGVQHVRFPLLLKVLTVPNQNVWLAGPSGSGKTQAAQNAADALSLKFYFCGAQSNEYGLLGFTDANGRTVRTLFREAYEHGGVFLFDEIDASSNSAVLALNAALANGHCAFPDAVVPRHPDCRIIAAANTWGLGGTNDYVGRVKLDAAFLKRFRFMLWDYDEQLEVAISGNPTWAKRVQSIRSKVRSQQIKVIISPRETVEGAKLLASGISQADVEELTIRAGMSDMQWESICAA